jgi:hypothetical protein
MVLLPTSKSCSLMLQDNRCVPKEPHPKTTPTTFTFFCRNGLQQPQVTPSYWMRFVLKACTVLRRSPGPYIVVGRLVSQAVTVSSSMMDGTPGGIKVRLWVLLRMSSQFDLPSCSRIRNFRLLLGEFLKSGYLRGGVF